jgi:hypothetical protein
VRRRIEAADREEKDCRRKDCEEGEGERGRAGGGDQHIHSPSAKPQSAASRPFPLLSHCVLRLRPSYHSVIHVINDDAWLLRPRLRTKHDCSAHDQLVCIASNTVSSCTKSNSAFPASSPRGRWRCASARQLSTKKSGSDFDLQSKVPRGHGHVGELGIPRTSSRAQGSNSLIID